MACWLKHDKVLFLLSGFAYIILRCYSTPFLSLFSLFVYEVWPMLLCGVLDSASPFFAFLREPLLIPNNLCSGLTLAGCQVPTKAALSLPLLNWTGEKT